MSGINSDGDDIVITPMAPRLEHHHGGYPIRMSGRMYFVPSMSVATARRHWERIERAQSGELTGLDLFDLTVDLLVECLARNYGDGIDVLRRLVEENLDMDNHAEWNVLCFGEGAWLRWAEATTGGNAVTPAQILAGAKTDGGGVMSSPPSSQPPDGGSPTSMH